MSAPAMARPEDHLGLVFSEARRVARRRFALGFNDPEQDSYQNFVGDGYLGLAKACATFDPSRGCKLSTLAIPRIRGAILDGIRAASKSRTKTRVAFTPIDDEAIRLRLVDERPTAIDAIEIESVRAAVRLVVDEPDVLTRQQRLVIVRRYWREERLHEIARHMHLTESRISQILSAAHERLFSALLPVVLGAPAGILRAIVAKRDARANKMPRRFQQKRCSHCGRAFQPTGPNARYCSAPCRKREALA